MTWQEGLFWNWVGGVGALAVWAYWALFLSSSPNRSETECEHGVEPEYCPECGIIDEQCANCRIPGGSPCPVYHVQLEHNYEQHDNPLLKAAMNKLINEEGKCLMKPILDALQFDEDGKQLFRPPMVGDNRDGRKFL